MEHKEKVIFYHAGCPVCVAAEQQVAHALDPDRYTIEIVHLGQHKERLGEAEKSGVKSVPAMVMSNSGQAFHINYGASLSDLR